MSKDIEKAEDEEGSEKEKKGMSQGTKEDIRVYVAVLTGILIATLITIIKIVTLDMNGEKYSSIFGPEQVNMTNSSLSSTTTSPLTN